MNLAANAVATTPDSSRTLTAPSVLISVLNWNTAPVTLACVDSLLRMASDTPARVHTLIIDNGSRAADVAVLQAGLAGKGVELQCQASNLGFTGGHNLAIERAIGEGHDYIWLVNSDTLVDPDTLKTLLATMETDRRCGVVSPVIMKMHDPERIDFCGAFHDWTTRHSIFPDSIAAYEALRTRMPENLWVLGTAALFRVSALRQTGTLDARLFAYYDDNDICARLAERGWLSRMEFSATIRHVAVDRVEDRKPYYFYLMQRNYLLFWHANTPQRYRRGLLLKLLSQSFYDVNRLYLQGRTARGDARMLGIGDFLSKRYGAPDLNRVVPLWMKALRLLSRVQQHRALKKALADDQRA